jgi:predicted lipoprotein with Yx(FWY)xxD motif
MMRSAVVRPLMASLLLAAVVLAPAGMSAAARRTAAPLVREERTKLGLVLATANGRTLYYFTKDRPGRLACVGHCLTLWPPLVVPASMKTPVVPKGVPGRFGVVARGKARQLTWDGHPLYTYAADTKAGQVNGQGVGKAWWAVVLQKASSSSGSGGSNGGGGW